VVCGAAAWGQAAPMPRVIVPDVDLTPPSVAARLPGFVSENLGPLLGTGLAPFGDMARAAYLPLIKAAAAREGVPAALADAVAVVETGYNADAVGSSGEIGLMQILPTTARLEGFRGENADLFLAETNVRFAVAYLGRAWAMSGGDVCTALMKYRAGLGETVMSPLSVSYCARARYWLASQGSNLAGAAGVAVPPPAAKRQVVAFNMPSMMGAGWRHGHYVYHRRQADIWGAMEARMAEHRLP